MSPETQIFLLILGTSVSARYTAVREEETAKEVSQMYLPATEKQKEFLAMSVCSNLENYLETQEALGRCFNEFEWNIGKDSDQSGFQIRCRSNSSITYMVPPSHLHQLVLLVPEPNNNDVYSLIYSIIRPNANYDKITITEGTNYTAYSAVLDRQGRPLVWRREPEVHSWTAPAKRDYDIKVEFKNTSNFTDGLITWNRTGDLDSCFLLVTRCENSKMLVTEIWPGSPANVKLKKLPLDDDCYAKVIGLYGTTTYRFSTHASNTEKPKMSNSQYAQNISIKAEEDGDSWTVRVAWLHPGMKPDSYNVTLRADNITSIVVNGNTTQVVFREITGERLFNVSVDAIFGNKTARTCRRAFFPLSRAGVWRWAGAAGGAWAAVGAAALAALLYCLRLRRRLPPPDNSQPIDSKFLDDEYHESLVESCCTDGWEVKLERLALHEVIGEGAFGVVRRGTLAPNGKEVAVKMLKDYPSLDETRSFRLEMELMKSVGAHPHVVSLLGCCSGRRPLIIAEYCSRGDLLSFLRCSWDVLVSKRNAKYYNNNYNNNIDTSQYRNDLFKCKLPQEQTRLVVNKMYDLQGHCDTELTSLDLLSFCRQIAMGMEFLSLNKMVHRDLAARNILVTGDKTLKIADFGLSRDVYEENQYQQKGNGKMPVKWMALESLTRRIYTTQSDVWSFGVVVWEVVTVGGAPYADVPAARLPRLLRAGYRMPRPHNCSKQLYDVMQSCWRERPRDRPTFLELHARLDALLDCACAQDYLSLELDDEPPPQPRRQRYFQMIMRAKRNWTRGVSYERPLKSPDVRYTSPPVTLNKTPT